MKVGDKFRFRESLVVMVVRAISDDYATLELCNSSGDIRTISIDQLNEREKIII